MAAQRTGPITIDGKLDPAEWDGADVGKATVIDRSPNVGPSPAPKSYAWVRRDDQFLYIGAMNLVNPDRPTVKDENMWWLSDMRIPLEDPQWLLRVRVPLLSSPQQRGPDGGARLG